MFLGAVAAVRTQVSTLLSSRASRWLFWCLILLACFIAAALPAGWLTRQTLDNLAGWLLLPGVPLAALVMAELPLRDGLTQRTLLYSLLGPASRATLVVARSVVIAAVVLLALGVLVVVLRVVAGSIDRLGADLPALLLASLCYVGLFGLLHLLTRRGLILGLALIALGDMPLAGVPYAIRLFAPAMHVQNLASPEAVDPLAGGLIPTTTSPLVSALVLLVATVLTTGVTAWRFSRMNLEELC